MVMTTFHDIVQLAYDLKESLEQQPEVVELEQYNTQLNHHQNLLMMTDRFHALQEDYTRLWEIHGDDHPQLLEVQKQLHQQKIQIDAHPLVRDYLKAYGQVRTLYRFIQNEIFDPFHTPIKGCI
jgi:cell fate (sporulation/competence/biofilm development) regulator YlbF (YheA/YmcA/DUF963 family)